MDDRQTRGTLPPNGEDNPPLAKPRRVSRPEDPPPETIARMALKAPKIPEDSHETLLRAMAASEERAKAFEESVRADLHRVVVQSALAPPAAPPSKPTLPPKPLSRDLSWLAQVPAILMALGALIATLAQSCQKKAEVSADVLAKITDVQNQLSAHVTAHTLDVVNQHALDQKHFSYDISERCYAKGLWQKLSIKVDDPPDAPACPEMKFYAAPARGSGAPQIQPNAILPAPPAP